jgi:hypothetical protein
VFGTGKQRLARELPKNRRRTEVPIPHIGSSDAVGRHSDTRKKSLVREQVPRDHPGTAAKRATDYNHKLIDIVRTNTRAAFDNVNELLNAKSPTQFIELSTAQLRKQFEIVSGQNKELCALAQEMATEAAGAIKLSLSKAFIKAN